MGHIWREQGVSDMGIDGHIELVDVATNAATGRLLLVQSKATAGKLGRETEQSFIYACSAKDIDYWMTASAPVLLVVTHTERKEAWFKNLSDWFSEPSRRASGLVEFDKSIDRFEAGASIIIESIGAPSSSGVYLQPAPKNETLVSNLLQVNIPEVFFLAPSSAQGWKAINGRLRSNGEKTIDDIVWSAGTLYSFRSFKDRPLKCLADDAPEMLGVQELQEAPNGDDRRLLVRLLNNTLREQLRGRLHWDRERQQYFFPATSNLKSRKVKVSQRSSGRTVFESYESQDDPERVSYYRHYAARFRFLDLDGTWYLSIDPTYHFTIDGYRESNYADKLLTGIKKREGHEAVRHLVTFWANYLIGDDSLLSDSDDFLDFTSLGTIDVEHGIDDDHWKPRHAKDEGIADQPSDQLVLDISS